MAYQPIYVLSEGAQQTRGRDAQHMNIAAGKAVAEAVRTTLGPLGMDKMLVDSFGSVVITNDGVTILDEMDIEHPAAQMLVEVAESQEEEAGDGTTTAVVLAGELLSRAEDLLDEDVHASTVSAGYLLAVARSLEVLDDYALEVSPDDEEMLLKIAHTAMTGKGVGAARERLSELVVRTVQAIAEDGRIDLDDVKIETVSTGNVDDSTLVEGVIIDKEPVHDAMPTRVEDATIALVNTAIEVHETETDAEINVTDPEQLQKFLDREEAELRGYVDALADADVDVLFCQKGIDDLAQHFLAKAGILAFRRVKKSDMTKLAKATGASVISKLPDIEADDLGFAGLVEERKVGEDELYFVEGCENPGSVSLVLRGGTEHVVEEVERSVTDALEVVRVTIEDGRVVPGGGAPEVELALALRDYAESVGGREQLAVEAFADAIEVVPRTLATNAGLDPIDTLVELRAAHADGRSAAGLSVVEKDVADMTDEGVVEPLRVKTQAIASAQEATDLILRIDDVIAAGDLGKGDDGMDEDFGDF